MPKRNLFAKLNNPSSSIPLRPFDLSQRKIYSSRAGMCVPELVMEVVKGDKIKINTTVFNRTDKLLAPAYFRCRQFHHFFFVPYHTLWHEWDAFFTQSTEKLSAATLGRSYFPNFDVLGFLDAMDTGSSSLGTDYMGYPLMPGIDRIMQMLGYGSQTLYDSQDYLTANKPAKYCNLARILAYNKIWYWYYRDKRHMPPSLFNNFVQYYNVDDVNCSAFANSHLDLSTQFSRLLQMFAPKYRTWDSDLFTNSFVDTQFGSVSVINSETIRIFNNLSNSDFSDITGTRAGITTGGYSNPSLVLRDSQGNLVPNSAVWNIPSLFDILQLRRAESVQHWRELMLRAGDSSKDRYTAMFGSHPNRSEEAPNYLGGFAVNLNIDDVTSNSFNNQQSSGNNKGLGDLAGKGIMSKDGDSLTFTAPDFGILMCISSIAPLSEYDGGQIDKANMLVESTDFYIPQYDKLGFEPVIRLEQVGDHQDMGNGYLDSVIGYSVRNHYLKTAVDRVYNNFRSGKSENYWVCPRRNLYGNNPNLNYNLNFRNYYISPNILNPLFDRNISTTEKVPDNAYNEDQFKCLTYFELHALRPMSELGLPSL